MTSCSVCLSLSLSLLIAAHPRDPPEARVYNPRMTSTEFAELAKLCQDQNTLGNNLLSMAKALSDQHSPQSEISRFQCCIW